MTHLRWFCPDCKRVDPRHPFTKPEELPDLHTRPESMGNMWTTNLCAGVRVPQSWDEEKKDWITEKLS